MMHPMMMVNPQGGPPMMHPYYGYPHPYNPMMVMVNPHTMSPMMQQNMMMGMQVGAFMCVGVWAGGGACCNPMMVMVNPHTMSPVMQQNMMMGMQVCMAR